MAFTKNGRRAVSSASERKLEPSASLPELRNNLSPPIVALGGSAGSFKALKDFFRVMPPDCGLAFVLVMHLDPKRNSTFPDVIRHWTKMRSMQAHGFTALSEQWNRQLQHRLVGAPSL